MAAVLSYRIQLTGPVLAAHSGSDANSRAGFPYLPGNLLRGAVIARYRQQHPKVNFDPADETIRRLFFDGRVRYLNAYPQTNGKRTLPVPRSWFCQKNGGSTAYDLAVEENHSLQDLKPIDKPFWIGYEDEAGLVQPKRRLTVHNQRERNAGRATEDQGAVYRYEALEAGQYFSGLVLCDHDEDATAIKGLLNGAWRLGTARSAGYGGVEVGGVQLELNAWREAGGDWDDHPDSLRVTLLSDALVRNTAGHPCAEAEAFTAVLSVALGVKLTLRHAFAASRPVSGFNRAWNLPLPQQPALAMGSVLVFAWPQQPGVAEKLQALEWSGIGGHRAEGFGRIAVNWLEQREWALDEADKPTGAAASAKLSGEAKDLAQRMAQRILQQRLDRRLSSRAAFYAIHSPPAKAQLGRLRIAVRNDMLAAKGAEKITKLLGSIENRNHSHAAFAQARISNGGEALLQWVKNIAAYANGGEWDGLRALFELGPADLPSVGGDRANPNTLNREYCLRLLDAVLARAQKQSAENSDREKHHG